MSKAVHTPGPWMAAAAPSSVVGWPIVGPGGRSIATVSWMPNRGQASDEEYAAFHATCEANAKLIGRAPDLLAQLKTAKRHLDHMAAFIGKANRGEFSGCYQLESLGEDMPGIVAAIGGAK